MTWQIKAGDARAVLAGEAVGPVQTVCTSPPFYGLRAYQTEPQIWGGAANCAHDWTSRRYYTKRTASTSSAAAFTVAGPANADRIKAGRWRDDTTCSRCGAWRGELGSESTVDLFVAHLVDVFRAVRRVLRPDGTCWVNLGDSFSHDSKWGGYSGGAAKQDSRVVGYNRNRQTTGLGDKQLLLVPARFALAMQADGWVLRQDIIWSKPNAMPESVTDRPTTAHEHVFLFARQARYFYDADAIREPHAPETAPYPMGRGKQGWAAAHLGQAQQDSNGGVGAHPLGRNKRSVWEIPTFAFPGAHFATWPPALVEPMIRAGSRPGDLVCDPFCGAGTTGVVALRLGRQFLGVELNPAYVALAERRIIADCPLFNTPQEVAI